MDPKLAVFLPLLLLVPNCHCLYRNQMTPVITITAGPYEVSTDGRYDPDYSNSRRNIESAPLYVLEDENVGCPGYSLSDLNITLPSPNSYFVVMLPYVGTNEPCSEFIKAQTARNVWGASGIIFCYDPDDPRGGTLRDRPSRSPMLSSITIVSMERLLANTPLQEWINTETPYVTIEAKYHQFQTSQTFYFIVFAFCILMLLSCLWFVMSYVKRCHYNIQRRRRRVRI